ncbi:hypothetical protein QFZ51_000373 [Chitinophaga sp. W3I9]
MDVPAKSFLFFLTNFFKLCIESLFKKNEQVNQVTSS